MQCPEAGWETIILNNISVKFMNYGHNIYKGELLSGLNLSGFLTFLADKIPIIITNSSFEYNISQNSSSSILYFGKLK